MKSSCDNCPDCKIAIQQPKSTQCTCSPDRPNIICGFPHDKAHEGFERNRLHERLERKRT